MKRMIIILAMIFSVTSIYCQTKLLFCTAVDPTGGYCVLNNTKFISSPDSTSTRIYMQIKSDGGFSSATVTYKIFSLDKKGTETFSHSFVQTIEKGWDMSWQPEMFNSPGTYLIKVYNDADLLMCSKSFELLKYW